MVRLTDCPDMTIAVYHGRKTLQEEEDFDKLCSRKFEGLKRHVKQVFTVSTSHFRHWLTDS